MRDLRYELVRRVFKLRPPARRPRRVPQGPQRPDVRRRGAPRRSLHPRRRHRPRHSCSCAARTDVARSFGLVARALAYEGFQVVIQSCRGTAGSGGRFDRPFRTEADDGRDTVAWLREQSFYPGRFATFCASYLGYVQLALPPESKTDLFGAVLQITPSNTQDIVWPADGALALATSLGWAMSAAPEPGLPAQHPPRLDATGSTSGRPA